MDGICEKLDKKNSAHCKHIVDDYYIPAFEVITFLIDVIRLVEFSTQLERVVGTFGLTIKKELGNKWC